MKSRLISLAATSFLAVACTPAERFYQPQTAVPEKPWSGTSGKWGGYSERRFGNGEIEVTFTGYNAPEPSACAYFVKIRAAERAVLDGHWTFYGAEPVPKQNVQESNFPSRVIPGRYEDVPAREWVKGPDGNAVPINVFRPVWVPPQTVPAHTEINTVNQVRMRINYNGGGKAHDAAAILKAAQESSQKVGKVQLDPVVEAKLKARL